MTEIFCCEHGNLLDGFGCVLCEKAASVAPLEEAGEPARPLGSMEFGGFTHAHLWDAYVAGVRDGQKHTSADEALIQGSADAYVKSVAPETTEPDDEDEKKSTRAASRIPSIPKTSLGESET